MRALQRIFGYFFRTIRALDDMRVQVPVRVIGVGIFPLVEVGFVLVVIFVIAIRHSIRILPVMQACRKHVKSPTFRAAQEDCSVAARSGAKIVATVDAEIAEILPLPKSYMSLRRIRVNGVAKRKGIGSHTGNPNVVQFTWVGTLPPNTSCSSKKTKPKIPRWGG